MADKSKPKKHEVVFYSYPKLLFAWPLILIGPLFLGLAGTGVSPELLGWGYLFSVVLVILTLGVDIERNHAVFWLVLFLAFFLGGLWLQDAKHFTLFGDVYVFFKDLGLNYDPGLGVGVSAILAVPYLVMVLWARLNDKWRITHNEFEHYAFGRADDSLARGAKRVRSTYPDLLELLLCGAGTLIVYSATGRSELRRIPHVPLLFIVRRRINRLLERTMITNDDAAMSDELDESEEDNSPGEEDGAGGEDPERL